MSRLDQHVGLVRTKLAVGTLLRALAFSGIGFAAVVCLVVLLDRQGPAIGLSRRFVTLPSPMIWFWVGLGLTILGPIVYTILRWPTARQAAVLIDERLGLKEAFSTALYMRSSVDVFAVAAVGGAERNAGAVVLGNRFPVRYPMAGLVTILLALLVTGEVKFVPRYAEEDPAKKAANADANRKNYLPPQRTLRQAVAAIDAAPPEVLSNEKIQMARKELSDMLKQPVIDAPRAQAKAEDALKEIASIKQKIVNAKNFATATEEMSLMKNVGPPSPEETGLVADAHRAIADQRVNDAVEDLKKAADKFSNMSQKEKEKAAEQMQKLAQQVAQQANNPQVQKDIEKQLQNTGMSQQMAQQMAQQIQQAANGNQQAQQQLQKMMNQAIQQANQQSGQSQQQQKAVAQAIQNTVQNVQQKANGQANAQQMAQGMQNLAKMMQQAAKQGGQNAQAKQGGQNAQAKGQQGQQGQQQANAQGGQQGQQQAKAQGGQQGQQQAKGQGGQQGQAMQQAQGGQGQNGQGQNIQQQMQQQVGQLQAMAKDAQAVAAGQQGQQGGQQGQGGQGQQQANGQWGQPQNNPGQGQGQGQGNQQQGQANGGGQAVANGGLRPDPIAVPYATKQELSPSQTNESGKIIAKTFIKAPAEKGESHATLSQAVESSRQEDAGEVETDRIPRAAQKAVKDYFDTLKQEPGK